jgi:hypothetical protein
MRIDAAADKQKVNRLIKRYSNRLCFDTYFIGDPKDNSVTPYLLEFQVSTAFSLLRLWQRRQKDLPPDELYNLIDKLFSSGISSVI